MGGPGSGRPCSVCNHPRQPEIMDAVAQGDSYLAIGRRFGVSGDVVRRHATRHGGVGRRAVGRTCFTCGHHAREEIDLALLAGVPVSHVATAVGLSRSSVGSHAKDHLRLKLPQGPLGACAVCVHPDREQIERVMRSGAIGHTEIGRIADVRWSVSRRHQELHLDNPEYEAKLAAVAVARLAAVKRYVVAS